MVLLSSWKKRSNSAFERSSQPHRSKSSEALPQAALTQPFPRPTEPQITTIDSRISPWLAPIAYGLGCWLLPNYFKIRVSGQDQLPLDGPVILAPTHRARWDSLLVPYAVGRFVTGRDLRFMVTADEVKGLQGWFIRRLGGFPVNPRHPAIASLRYGVEVLQNREMLVIYPEGNIYRDHQLRSLKPGLARLALQAEASKPGLGIKVVPIHLEYSQPYPQRGCKVNMAIGEPLEVAAYSQGSVKQNAQCLTEDLEAALRRLGSSMPASEI